MIHSSQIMAWSLEVLSTCCWCLVQGNISPFVEVWKPLGLFYCNLILSDASPISTTSPYSDPSNSQVITYSHSFVSSFVPFLLVARIWRLEPLSFDSLSQSFALFQSFALIFHCSLFNSAIGSLFLIFRFFKRFLSCWLTFTAILCTVKTIVPLFIEPSIE